MMYKKENRYAIKKRVKSFGYAFQGIAFAWKTQVNLWIHTLAAVAVIVAGWLVNLDTTEWLIIIFCIGFVIATELLNTSIEYLSDVVYPGHNMKIKRLKDIAAAAVLISSLTAAIIGLMVFVPKLGLF